MSKSILLKEAISFSKERISVSSASIDSYVTTDNLLPNKLGVTRAVSLPPQVGNIPAYNCENILFGNIRPYLKKYGSPTGVEAVQRMFWYFRPSLDIFQNLFIMHCLGMTFSHT